MIDSGKLEYFTLAAWLRGYAEGSDNGDYVSPSISKKLRRAADMLEFVFKSEVDFGGNENDTE